VSEAVRLVTEHQIDDYFIFKPIYDPQRLYLCVQHALERSAARKELSGTQINLKAAEDLLREILTKGMELQTKSEQSHVKLFQSIMEKIDQFERGISRHESSNAVQVISPTKLNQHFRRLKEELQPEFESFENELMNTVIIWFGELKKRYRQEIQQRNDGQAPQDETAPYSILIVEDDPQSLQLLTAILESEGYRIDQASNGNKAIIQALRNPPDLILMDITRPGIDGLEVVRRLKANPNLKDIAIVVVTSPTSKETLQRILEMEEAGSIAKPIRRQAVLEKIQQFSHRS
jgi:CheY-like chemotaxis protein